MTVVYMTNWYGHFLGLCSYMVACRHRGLESMAQEATSSLMFIRLGRELVARQPPHFAIVRLLQKAMPIFTLKGWG